MSSSRPALHLVTGGDERRRRLLTGAGPAAGRVLTWGTGLLEATGRAEDAHALVPPSLAVLEAEALALLAALELPGEVAHDLTAALRDPDRRALVGVAAALDDGSDDVVVLAPAECDPARLVSLAAGTARSARALVPVLARWEVLLGPQGIGALRRPAPAALTALRQVADLLERLDGRLADDAVLHHLPGPGLVETGRTAELTVALALMGRALPGHGAPAASTGAGEITGGPEGVADDPFVVRIPLPGLTAQEIVLEREGDDLVVTAGRHRRSTRLGALQRRCTVTDAGMRQGVLTLTLERDPQEWPA